jgi:hypothetical protein
MKNALVCLLIVFLAFWAVKPLLSSGYFSMHDDQQVVRLQQFDKSLRAGQFPVRWVEDLGYGYGYPLFNFYPPLAYFTGEAIHLITGLGFVDSIKGVWLLAIIGSGLAMYFFAKEFFGRPGGIVAAVFYMYAPYHAVDAYVRGALAELCSFVWLPLILLMAYKRRPLLTGFFLGLLMITHNLIFLPFAGLFCLWVMVIEWKSPISGTKLVITSILIAFGLTAFFWLPSLAEKQFTLVDQLLIKNLASYKIHFLCLQQLWYSPWGFGGSTAGCIDGMSFMVGKIFFFSALTGLLVGVFKRNLVIVLAFGLFVFSLWMTTDYSKPVWDSVSLLWYLQFPWRFLEFAVLFSSFLAGTTALLFNNNKYCSVLTPVALVAAVIVIGWKYFVPQTTFSDATDKTYRTDEFVKWRTSDSSFEYLPRGVKTIIGPLGTLVIDIDRTRVKTQNLKVVRGTAIITNENFSPGNFSFMVESDKVSVVEIQQTNFVGWKAWINGQSAIIGDNNPYRLLTLEIPPGVHKVWGRFSDTTARKIGNLTSISCIILLGAFFVWKKKK